jgi:hypothetical protein
MRQVDRKCNITGIRDASVKLPIKMAVKEQEEADVLNMVELLSSPYDQLLARHHGIQILSLLSKITVGTSL